MSKLGKILISIGVFMLLASACLVAYNANIESNAEQQVLGTADVLLENIRETASVPQFLQTEDAANGFEIDGVSYMAVLSIPDLGRLLPIASKWNEVNLKTAPCYYSGSAEDGALVLAGHNYRAHFGGIENLPIGSEILLTLANGTERRYQVAYIEVLDATDVAGMTETDWALSLFTCTYDGQRRITLRCTAAEQE